MEVWVLIIGLYLQTTTAGISMATHEFTSEQTCRAAGEAMVREWKRGVWVASDLGRFVCVRK